jgi:hypothetical protein
VPLACRLVPLATDQWLLLLVGVVAVVDLCC